MVFVNYLRLGERLSQIWINKYTLALLLSMVKLVLFSRSLSSALSNSEEQVIGHCSSVDKLYNNIMNNTPHYLGTMGNYMIEKSMIETVKLSLKTLSLMISASEGLFTFMVDLYLGTYACLIVSAIDGTVDVATNTTEKLLGALNGTVHNIASDLDDGLDDLSKVINKIISVASKVEKVFTDDDDDDDEEDEDGHDVVKKLSRVNLTVSGLRNLYIPSSINDKLRKLSRDTPSFDELKNSTKQKIALPFSYAHKEVKKVNVTQIFQDRTSTLYVPSLSNTTLLDGNGVCTRNIPAIRHVYSDLLRSVHTATKIFVVLLAVGAVCALVPVAYDEWRQWRRLQELNSAVTAPAQTNPRGEISKEAEFCQETYSHSSGKSSLATVPSPHCNNTDVFALYQRVFHRWQTRIASAFVYVLTLGNRLKLSAERQSRIEWFVAYVTSARALTLLGIGLLALLVCILQLAIIGPLQRKVATAAQSHALRTALSAGNDSTSKMLQRDMTAWSLATNLYIADTEQHVNQEAFGWINHTTTQINSTVVHMLDEIDSTLGDIFNGTLLYRPMRGVVKCVIGDKLRAVERAMTWVNHHAQLALPRVNATELLQSTLSNNGNGNATDTTAHQLSRAVDEVADEARQGVLRVLRAFRGAALQELYVALALLGAWALQWPVAAAILACRAQ
ncbi:pheromone-regulated protein [Maudiozyma humilis]|uniref:Plasma membrane fusion protein PRM1 n=1 Tax=Maudiozyma humilis TaxID=51915 RepID=A0AAV5S231_MAUHU|nr:pheromone-regulated protein [Kazachstania humilis]